ncbi:MAG: hypothetical protein BWY14_01028 [Parcubacteria group bacterium ADurb.Bin192]|nr:MAG: hypothetical protein BWY14_01028 [Parcubacteria group bacterium ADurb.Bin192]
MMLIDFARNLIQVNVRSKSWKELSHKVTIQAECTCKAFIYGNTCSHINSAIDYYVRKRKPSRTPRGKRTKTGN